MRDALQRLRFTELPWTLQNDMDQRISTLKRSKVDQNWRGAARPGPQRPRSKSKCREFADKTKGK